MSDKDMLEAMRQMMDERDRKLEAMIDAKLEPIKAEQVATNKRLDELQKDMQSVKHDVKEITWKVDTLYNWVDSVDLKVNRIDDRTR